MRYWRGDIIFASFALPIYETASSKVKSKKHREFNIKFFLIYFKIKKIKV